MAKSAESLEKIPAAKVMKYETDMDPTRFPSEEPAASFTHYTENNLVGRRGASQVGRQAGS